MYPTLMEAVAAAKDLAAQEERLQYVCERQYAYIIDPTWCADYLIKVYPGGRCQASLNGANEIRRVIEAVAC